MEKTQKETNKTIITQEQQEKDKIRMDELKKVVDDAMKEINKIVDRRIKFNKQYGKE